MSQNRDPSELERRLTLAEKEARYYREVAEETGKKSLRRVEQLEESIAQRKLAEEELQMRLGYERLLAEISTLAVETEDCDTFQSECVELMGKVLDVSRVYVFEHDSDSGTVSNTHEWVASGITPQRENLQEVPTEEFLWWMNILQGNKVINYEDTADIPSEKERESLEAQSVKSILVVPMFAGGKYCGFMGFDECRACRQWPRADVELLQAASRIITGAVERLHMEDALRASEQKFRLIAETSIDDIWQLDLSGTVIYVSPAVERIFGYTPQEALGLPFSAFFPESETGPATEAFTSAVSGRLYQLLEFTGKRRDGSVVPLEISVAPIVCDGTVIGVQGIARDVSERRRAAEALEEREELLRATLESTGDGILVVNEKGRVTHSNRRMIEMWRVPEELFATGDDARLVAFAASQLMNPDDFLGRVDALYKSTDEEYDTLVFKDGRVFERHSCPLTQHGAIRGRVWSFRDITEQEGAKQRARQREAELLHVSRLSSLGEMASSLSHELSQPLSAISSLGAACAQLASADLPDMGRIARNLEKVIGQADRAKDIMHRIKEFAQRRQLHLTSVDLNQAATNTVDLLSWEIQQREIVVDLDLADQLPLVCADLVQVEQVLVNLTRNAIEAMEEAGKEPGCLTIRTRACEEGSIRLEVSDTGVGLPRGEVDRLFDAFFTTKRSGLGIGLSISRSIVEMHGGVLEARRNDERGSTFVVTLPTVADDHPDEC